MSTDILLTHGYFLAEDAAEARIMKPYAPLGILSLSAYLKERGFGVEVFDTTFSSLEAFRAHVAASKPPVVGISSNLMTKLNVVPQIALCKDLGAAVVVGGPDVPGYAEEYLRCGADAAVLGEGEETLAELLPALARGGSLAAIPGIACLDAGGAFVRTPPRPLIASLDMLPRPDRAAIDIQRYLATWRAHHGRGSLSLICARGCPFSCTWCSRSIYGETHRRRSPESVADEIEELVTSYHPDMLWFADDVFTINHAWFHRFHAEMMRRGLRIPFECITRADRLNDEILRKMAELGAFRIWYGSESGSQKILDAMERRVSTAEIRAVTKSAQRYGIEAGLFVMLGYPGEEIPDIEETVEHLRSTGADTFLTTVAYPIRGTQYYEEVAGRIIPGAPWAASTDRSVTYGGRHTKRFYYFAQRYVVNAVLERRLGSARRFGAMAAAFAKARVARIGMAVTAAGAHVNSPFDGEAATYDERFEANPVTPRLRRVVLELLAPLAPGARLLDMNCGTGTDALTLAGHGICVTAFDPSGEMLTRARAKAAASPAGTRIEFRRESFDGLSGYSASSFDAVLSNFGGLNCIPDPSPVIANVARILVPGGIFVLSLLNATSLWESGAGVLRGRFGTAFRRFRHCGTALLAGGAQIAVRYASLPEVRTWLAPSFTLAAAGGLSICSPPPNARAFAAAAPRLTAALLRCEDAVRWHRPWNMLGDHLVVKAVRR